MIRDDDTIYAEAVRWQAQSAGDDMDWDGFTLWLEADPRHAEAFDAVALGDALIGEHRDALGPSLAAAIPANDAGGAPAPAMPQRRAWGRWAGAAIAASLVALVAVPQIMPTPAQTYATAAARQTIVLADGSSVVLAPHSVLTVQGRSRDRMALNGGAWFDIRHDPSRSLTISAGGVEIGDIGTRFDVQDTAGALRVAVAQGTVTIRSSALARPIGLAAGHGLLFDAQAGTAVVRPVAAGAIGEWRSGRLTFASTPLPLVAADLSRYAGIRVGVARGLRNRQFSGTLVVGDGEAAVHDLSQLLDVELRRTPDGVMLDERR